MQNLQSLSGLQSFPTGSRSEAAVPVSALHLLAPMGPGRPSHLPLTAHWPAVTPQTIPSAAAGLGSCPFRSLFMALKHEMNLMGSGTAFRLIYRLYGGI